ncbi:DUF732 domain-containing protein [Actinoplanes bogorensis]|uniref:DUF732 domain-containing protein n=1 Tax=Paractinoplanes bogorensis TaxID=1610840 RepID=A0ABS5YLP6_9ACTN|nr:DUF732 domain-containing protein [Actinoplanes bogorensis]MBU2664357.1 DUF732 domain-containing protein [Actinoplanes bogorensis]
MGARLAVAGTVLVAVFGLGSLSACSGGDDTKSDTSGGNPSAAAVKDVAGSLPKGDEATFIKALRALDPALVKDEQTAIDNGYNLCQDAKNGMTVSEQVTDATNLFSTNAKNGQRIVAIATTNLCKPAASAGS